MNSSARPDMFHVRVECSTWTRCGSGLDPWGGGIVFHIRILVDVHVQSKTGVCIRIAALMYVRWWVRMCMYRVVYVRLVCGRNL
jgi:hypothetical protein